MSGHFFWLKKPFLRCNTLREPNDGVPANKFLFAGIVPANKFLFSGTVPANKFLFAGTVPAYNLFLIGISLLQHQALD